MASRLFADLSDNNTHFNAAEYAGAGHVIVALKATEGTTEIDFDHRGWCLQAHIQRLSVIHYHFARPDINPDAAAEAAHFLSVVHANRSGRDYVALDLERATPQGWTHDPAWSRQFDQYVLEHSHYHTILYANRSTLEGSADWLVNGMKRVWDADWSTTPDYAPPGYQCALRQFTDGVNGPQPHALPGVDAGDVNSMSRQFAKWVMFRRPK